MEVFVIETCLYCREMSVLHRLRAVSLFLQIYLGEWTRTSVEPLPSRAFGHARGHLRVSGVLLDGPRKKRDCS